MTRYLSPLEWLGVEMALRRYFLKSDPQATILARLVSRAGLTVRDDDLVLNTPHHPGTIKVYVCYLRKAMVDLGFKVRIENVKDCGYRISESGAVEIMGRIAATLDHVAEGA